MKKLQVSYLGTAVRLRASGQVRCLVTLETRAHEYKYSNWRERFQNGSRSIAGTVVDRIKTAHELREHKSRDWIY